MKTRNILISSISTLIFGIAITSGGILSHTNANVDKVELLTRAVQQDNLKNLERARGDIDIQSGINHSGAIIGDKVYMWGNNAYGQLGTGNENPRNVPTPITIPNGKLTQLVLGGFHSAVVVDSNIYIWGLNNFGQLGLGNTTNKNIPTHLTTLTNVSYLALGGYHSGAIINGKIYMWGNGTWGQLGTGWVPSITFPGVGDGGEQPSSSTPTLVKEYNIEGMTAIQLSLGDFHSGAILIDPKDKNKRKLYTWGANWNRQLGYSGWGETAIVPDWWWRPAKVKAINKKGDITSISFGGQNSSAIVGGKLYTWGDNQYGQLGLGWTSKWEWVKETPITEVASASFSPNGFDSSRDPDSPGHLLARTTNGTLYTSGANNFGQLGDGGTTQSNSLKPNTTISNVTHVSAGNHFSVAIANGKIYTWGDNSVGQLGNGTNKGKNPTPTIVNIFDYFKINLDPKTDPQNRRSKVVYNYNNNDFLNIVDHNSGPMNLPFKYSLTNTQIIGSVVEGANRVGRVITEVDIAFPITTRVTIDGFLPVNETALVEISPKEVPEDDTWFGNVNLNTLINDARMDTTGTKSTLARWIIKNSSLIIGNHSTYTQDFPAGAVITKADGFAISSSSSEDAEFNIYVNKYYQKSGNNLVLSTSGAPVKIVQKVVLSGLPNAITYEQCVDPDTGKLKILETQINPQTDANKFFEAITGSKTGGTVINRLLLGQYIDTRFIPADAVVTLERLPIKGQIADQVSFNLVASKYYLNYKLINDPQNPFEQDLTFFITKQESSISVKNKIDGITSTVTTGDALDEMLLDKLIFNKDSSKYFNFMNFPLNTVFTLERVINNFNEDGILELSIKADNYYEFSSLNPMYQSKLFPVTIKGFKSSHDIDVYPVITSQNQKIELDLTKDQFYNQIIIDNIPNRAFIGQYIDLRAIPADANLSITKMQYNDDGTITLAIKSDKYYNDGGTTINQTYEATVLVILPEPIDLTLIISLSAGGAFLIFFIVCIILTMKNKNKLKSK